MLTAWSAASLASTSRPHVLMVVVDDLGWNDVGYHQNKASSANPDGRHQTTDAVIATPVIDRLASEGLKLENLYVQPLCSPTRASIMTGRYPSHYGIGHDVIGDVAPFGVPSDEVFLAQKFKSAGYDTHAIGKSAWSKWRLLRRHSWPPEAPRTASEGLGLPYALGMRGLM